MLAALVLGTALFPLRAWGTTTAPACVEGIAAPVGQPPTDPGTKHGIGPAAGEGLEAALITAGVGAAIGMPGPAQPARTPALPPGGTPAGRRAPRWTSVWKVEDVWPLTCAQAWERAGRSEPGMVGIVRTLAHVSLANRDLLFPDTREAGLDAGKGIAEDCAEDPAGLLFATVDKHARRVAEAAASPRQ